MSEAACAVVSAVNGVSAWLVVVSNASLSEVVAGLWSDRHLRGAKRAELPGQPGKVGCRQPADLRGASPTRRDREDGHFVP
jgi:hypothetical protein